MRTKKLSRQLKKTLDSEDVERDLCIIKSWLLEKFQGPEIPGPLLNWVDRFPGFLDLVETSYEQYENNLSHAQRSLEISSQEVEDRNRLLRIENRKVSNLLDHMRQAVFSVERGGEIVGPVSKYSEMVFGSSIIGQNVFECLYQHIPHDSEQFSALESAMNAVFGESHLQWDLVEDHFPRRLTRSFTNDHESKVEQVLKIVASPIWDEQGLLEKIMYVVEDVTEVEKLEKKVAEERAQSSRNLQMIQEFLSVRDQGVSQFFSKSESVISDSILAVESLVESTDFFSNLLKDLHTIKGNARILGFLLISSTAHRVESGIIELRNQILNQPDVPSAIPNEIQSLLQALISIVNEYRTLLGQVFGDHFYQADNQEDLLTKLKKYESMVKQIATECGKEVEYVVLGDSCVLPSDQISLLQDAVVHLLRNSIDHGLEPANDRMKSGKNPIGRIEIVCRDSPTAIHISVSDDGYGIDPEWIAKKVISSGLLSVDQIQKMNSDQKLNLIFIPGFSTKDAVNEISGRGVGLDIVKANIEGPLQGSIQIDTRVQFGTCFTIRIPR